LTALVLGVPLWVFLAFAGPFIIWFLMLGLMRWFPEYKIAVYDGFQVSVRSGDCTLLRARAPVSNRLFIKVGEKGIAFDQLKPADLEQEGFEPFLAQSDTYAKGAVPIMSVATFRNGRLYDLSVDPGADVRVRFSGSPDGPFLSLPVAYKEFRSRFGKPIRWKYVYPNFSDPR
jgi:hypothetical protein